MRTRRLSKGYVVRLRGKDLQSDSFTKTLQASLYPVDTPEEPAREVVESNTDVVKLLTEIRDDQRKQIEAYETATSKSLAFQERAVDRQDEAVDRQKKIVAVYFKMLVVGGVLFVGIVGLIIYLLRLLSHF